MDKYEYKLKLDQMKSLTAEGKYEEALALFEAVGDYKDALKWVEDIKKLP